MTRARSELVDLSITSYYHCINRCVRRAFLCGKDSFSGNNYNHRRSWVVDRLAELETVFAIEVCSYAVMSNHYHLVLRIDKEMSNSWDDKEVIIRWGKLFKLPSIIVKYINCESSFSEREVAKEIVNTWRNRLMDLSWYMRMLNEYLARKANSEDGCTGHFWEGRFKSQALLDDAAVLACMSYVDLNPIRAKLADSLESSNYTSIQQRINSINNKSESTNSKTTVPLMPMSNRCRHSISILEKDYIELLVWAVCNIYVKQRDVIPQKISLIFNQSGLEPGNYLKYLSGNKPFLALVGALGQLDKLVEYANLAGVKFIKGFKQTQALYQ